jgi:hypothetical protein
MIPRCEQSFGTPQLVILVVGGKDGCVGRDGMLANLEGLPRRQAFGGD